MRSFLLAGLACLLPVAAHADVVYTLVLTPGATSANAISGTGSFSLSAAPSTATGTVTDFYTAGNPLNTGNALDALNFTIGGNSFGLASEQSGFAGPVVEFTSGMLTGITYNGQLFGTGIFNLGTSGLTYNYAAILNFQTATGGITVTSPTTPASITPEPSSLALLGTGMLAGMALLRRRLA